MDATPEGFDLAALLAPIAGDNPAGANLREDYTPQSIYYRLRDARAEARAAERQADAEPEVAAAWPPQWSTIRNLAAQALQQRSKDLEIAAWFTEALLRGDGLPGLVAGCRVIAGLVDNFWEVLYPLPDEENPEARIAMVVGLNGEGRDGTLIQPLRKLTLFTRPDGAPLPVWRYGESAEVSALGDAAQKQRRLDAGVLPFTTVEDEARAAGAELAQLRDAAAAAGTAWLALSESLAARAGADAMPGARVRDLLQQIEQIAAQYASSATAAPAAAGATAPAGVQAATNELAGAPTAATPTPLEREEALRQLASIAAFFRRTEPHSPLSYTLQEAIRRARLPWPELLEEVVPDPSSRAAILSGLGIKPPSQG